MMVLSSIFFFFFWFFETWFLCVAKAVLELVTLQGLPGVLGLICRVPHCTWQHLSGCPLYSCCEDVSSKLLPHWPFPSWPLHLPCTSLSALPPYLHESGWSGLWDQVQSNKEREDMSCRSFPSQGDKLTVAAPRGAEWKSLCHTMTRG